MDSGSNNWTIIRLYFTYNDQRLQLGVYEKENWLYRVLCGRTIVMSADIADGTTLLAYGLDVATVVENLIGNEEGFGQVFYIVYQETTIWGIYYNSI